MRLAIGAELMLTRLFHAWEHRLASVTKDRVIRPFEWGLDWLPADARHGDPRTIIEQWADASVSRDDEFFALPYASKSDFCFVEAPRDPGRAGETGTLTFPSALTTPHPENNVVTARWFAAPGESAVGPAKGRGRAVVVLPQWNSDAEGHIGLARVLARFGVSALRLTLPYHDVRMPPELTRADYIVSANIVRTVQVCRQAVLDARRAVAWLASQGFEKIGILGTSLGSCLALLTASHEPLIRAEALNHVSPFFADVVWRGLSTRHVREGLEGHVDLEELRRLWRAISPWTYLDRLHRTQTLLVYAKYDLTFPVDLSLMLIEEFRRRGLPHEAAMLPCGHYSTGSAPFKFLDGYVLTRFLRRAL